MWGTKSQQVNSLLGKSQTSWNRFTSYCDQCLPFQWSGRTMLKWLGFFLLFLLVAFLIWSLCTSQYLFIDYWHWFGLFAQVVSQLLVFHATSVRHQHRSHHHSDVTCHQEQDKRYHGSRLHLGWSVCCQEEEEREQQRPRGDCKKRRHKGIKKSKVGLSLDPCSK